MIGIFGGTFDPIHFGHISLALSLIENKHVDRVWFSLAKVNPLKLKGEPLAFHHRLKMLHLAIDSIKNFELIDLECQREGPSYTIETIHTVINEYPNQKFRLILGEDAAEHFDQWKSPKEIIRLTPPLVVSRKGVNSHLLKKWAVDTPVFDISSTEIRMRVRKGLYIGHLVPGKVIDYISKNRLYSQPNERNFKYD